MTNAARHSQCLNVAIDLRADARSLTLRITDDGVGFDPGKDSEGHGLENMRQRAQALGAEFSVRTRGEEGQPSP